MKQAMLRMVLLTLAAAGVSASAWSQGKAFDEYQVKAAFLYQFAQFVEWPAEVTGEAGQPFNVCVLGGDPSNGAVESTIKDKKVNGRPVQVTSTNEVRELNQCHVLFAAASGTKTWKRLSKEARSLPILTVGEGREFLEAGGMIALFTEKNRIRFEINLTAGEQAGLRISSKLLALAKVVHVTAAARGE